MFSGELKEVIVQVLTSWQVLVVTIGIILYIFIVSYASQLYRTARPKAPKVAKPKKEKKADKVTEDTGELGLGE
ncbi:hypothetical protein AGMMS49942_07490 [Spirochaetia bacterium]|nr:hypothetical protein AGMMS49942_07490 [Spirochaetia bacterium]